MRNLCKSFYFWPNKKEFQFERTRRKIKRLEKYVGDYKLNYYISKIDEKEKRFNYTPNNDIEKIIRLIDIGDKKKKMILNQVLLLQTYLCLKIKMRKKFIRNYLINQKKKD